MQKFSTANEKLGTIVILACVVAVKTATLSNPQRHYDFRASKEGASLI